MRVGLAGSDAVKRRFHGALVAAVPTYDSSHRPVHLDDQARVVAGPLVQLVDVLSHQSHQTALPLEIYKRGWPGFGAAVHAGDTRRCCQDSCRTSGSCR